MRKFRKLINCIYFVTVAKTGGNMVFKIDHTDKNTVPDLMTVVELENDLLPTESNMLMEQPTNHIKTTFVC